MATNTIFQLTDVSVGYGGFTAVRDISLSLVKGQALGLIGINGAGKTSTLRALLGMVKLKSGKVSVFGGVKLDQKALIKIGFAPEEGGPPEYLTGLEYLRFVGGFKINSKEELRKQVDELLSWFELDPNKTVKNYSKGMRRRLVLAQAFIGTPDFLVLDEPLNGLDPLMILKLRERVVNYRKNGGSILYSSHILSEIENTCSDIVILHKGSIVTQATVAQLVQDHGSVEKAFTNRVGI